MKKDLFCKENIGKWFQSVHVPVNYTINGIKVKESFKMYFIKIENGRYWFLTYTGKIYAHHKPWKIMSSILDKSYEHLMDEQAYKKYLECARKKDD